MYREKVKKGKALLSSRPGQIGGKRFNSLEQRGRVQILFEHSFKFEQYSAGYYKELVYLKTPSTVEKCIYYRNITKLRGEKCA